MVLPAGKFENPLTCPNIDIGALELTWRGCAISTKDKNIVQCYGMIHLWNYHLCSSCRGDFIHWDLIVLCSLFVNQYRLIMSDQKRLCDGSKHCSLALLWILITFITSHFWCMQWSKFGKSGQLFLQMQPFLLNGIWSNLQLWIVSCIPICGKASKNRPQSLFSFVLQDIS